MNNLDTFKYGSWLQLAHTSHFFMIYIVASGVVSDRIVLTEWDISQVECIDLLYKHAVDEQNYFEKKEKDPENNTSEDWLHLRAFMCDLCSVLDYTYLLLYCHFAKKGLLELSHEEASKCSFPYWGGKIKISENRDKDCRKFNDKYFNFLRGGTDQDQNIVKNIVKILYRIQPKEQQDENGKLVKRTMEMESINDEEAFACLRYFRNYSTHRSLVCFASKLGEWFIKINVKNRHVTIVNKDEKMAGVIYRPLGKGYWITMPDGEEKMLLFLLAELLEFVKNTIQDLIKMTFTA